MNILILELPSDLHHGTTDIPRARLAEMITRRDLQIGHQLTVGILNGAVGTAIIERIESEVVTISFRCEQPSPRPLPLECILAIPRPQILKRLWRDAAMLGIEKLTLVRSALTDKNFLKSHMLHDSVIEENLRLGLEQAVCTIPPRVCVYPTWSEFQGSWQENKAVKILACPSGESSVATLAGGNTWTSASESRAILAIGPERGWTARECAWFVEHGFDVVNFSPRVLRVDVAISYISGILAGIRSKATNEKAG